MEDGKRSLHQRPGHLLRRAHQRNVATFLETTAAFKITPLQFAVLKALEELGPSTQRALSSYIAMEPSNIHPMLHRMTANDLIAMESDSEDKRRTVISLVEKGRVLLEQIHPLEEQSNELLLHSLNDEQKKQFIELLNIVIGEEAS